MTWLSTTPDAITNLVAALRAVLGQHEVKDGPEVSSATLQQVVTVGFTDEDNPAAVDGISAAGGASSQPRREQYSIHCKAEAVNGATDIVAARAAAYELLGIVSDVLAADQTLGGSVMNATVGSVALTQTQPSNGARAVLLFDVDCDAFMKRIT